MNDAEALLIGGRAGVGKTTVAWEVSALLRTAEIAHAIVEGDYLGQVHPAPTDDPLRSLITERNLTALWGNFAALGHRRLVYTNTASVLPETAAMFRRAMGAEVRIIRVLLTATDATTRQRLLGRELGGGFAAEFANSQARARMLDERVGADAVRIPTDDRRVTRIAADVVTATGWT